MNTDTIETVGRDRGAHNSNSHERSNNYAIPVADMFERYGANIKSVIVNDDRVAERDSFNKETFGWDMELSVNKSYLPPDIKKLILGDGIDGVVDLKIEIETKLVMQKYLKDGDTIWPSCFRTADFGWVK
jgi:hypothetical protein